MFYLKWEHVWNNLFRMKLAFGYFLIGYTNVVPSLSRIFDILWYFYLIPFPFLSFPLAILDLLSFYFSSAFLDDLGESGIDEVLRFLTLLRNSPLGIEFKLLLDDRRWNTDFSRAFAFWLSWYQAFVGIRGLPFLSSDSVPSLLARIDAFLSLVISLLNFWSMKWSCLSFLVATATLWLPSGCRAGSETRLGGARVAVFLLGSVDDLSNSSPMISSTFSSSISDIMSVTQSLFKSVTRHFLSRESEHISRCDLRMHFRCSMSIRLSSLSSRSLWIEFLRCRSSDVSRSPRFDTIPRSLTSGSELFIVDI